MCIHAGEDELDSVKNLMSMSLKAVVAEALHVELDDITPDTRLVEDLRMGPAEAEQLKALIEDIFDGAQINLRDTNTFGDLLERVVLIEFRDLGTAHATDAHDLAA